MLAAAAAAFITVFVAEFGDKTQLVCLAMACRYPPLQVLAGAMVALAAVIGLAVGVGSVVAVAFPHALVAVISGIVFIVIGIYTYLGRDSREKAYNGRNGFLQTLIMVFVAEFGDKTQVAAMFLAASLGYPLAVFAGAMAAMLLNHTFAVYLGSKFFSRIKPRYVRLGTAFLFVAIGLLIIVLEANTGLKI